MEAFTTFFTGKGGDLYLRVDYASEPQKHDAKDLRNLSHKEFVDTVYADAKKDESTSKVPAAVTTAQACLETGYGKSVPTDIDTGTYSYNLFGIKGVGSAGSVTVWTHEVEHGVRVKIKDKFQAYHSFEESIAGRSDFFRKNKRYHHLFNSTDPNDWANGLQSSGYATDPDYAKKLIAIIKIWSLT
jgi:flagellum-specific peptidoglycan hydrolase FlgJ